MKYIFSFLSIALLFSACSTDLDVTGDYKETMVVYGLLDQSQTKQYIKINKAFLGQGNALVYAQIKDSVQYANSLTVELQRVKNGSDYGAPIVLSPDSSFPKDSLNSKGEPGVFYWRDQANAIYSTSSPIYDDSEYKLKIINNETGNQVRSYTPLVSDFNFLKPSGINTPTFNFVIPNNPLYQFKIEWATSKNAKIYQLVIRLNYTEYTASSSEVKYLDWVFPAEKTESTNGGEFITTSFVAQDYLKFIANQMPNNPNVTKRVTGNVDLLITGGAEELSTFIEVNKPSTGIIQEKPEYTNITNGLGIFSSRYNKPPFGRPMDNITKDSLSGGQYTCKLKFTDHNGSQVNNCN